MRSDARYWPTLSTAEAALRPQFELLDRATRAIFDGPDVIQRVFAPGTRVLAEGERPGTVEVILDGWAASYKSLRDGRRQIISFLLPGDLIGMAGLTGHSSVTIEAITELRLQSAGLISPTMMELYVVLLVQHHRMEELLLSLGQRDAVERTAALLLDLFDRAAARQMVTAGRLQMPLTQKHLSAALGISAVHANRVMSILKRTALVRSAHGRLEVTDRESLARAAQQSATGAPDPV